MADKNVELFGGAIVCSVPPHWRDVSMVRQVPDNQEVYQDCTEETGGVLVVEIMQYQDNVSDEEAGSFFFVDLAESNGYIGEGYNSLRSQVFDSSTGEEDFKTDKCDCKFIATLIQNNFLKGANPQVGNCCVVSVGTQTVMCKDTSAGSPPTEIRVEMCVLRLKKVDTDLLITLSTPANSPYYETVSAELRVSETFQEVLSSFRVVDWSLFG